MTGDKNINPAAKNAKSLIALFSSAKNSGRQPTRSFSNSILNNHFKAFVGEKSETAFHINRNILIWPYPYFTAHCATHSLKSSLMAPSDPEMHSKAQILAFIKSVMSLPISEIEDFTSI